MRPEIGEVAIERRPTLASAERPIDSLEPRPMGGRAKQ
jgi:hypothetical protein